MNNELKRQLAGMNDADLADAEATMKAVQDDRRAKIDLNDIKVGMKPEDLARVRAELARIAAGR
jgi:hypothetical protein